MFNLLHLYKLIKMQTIKEKIIKDIEDNIKPTAKKWLEKEIFKINKATQFIGVGSPNSSTYIYDNIYKKYNLSNTGIYNEDDLIWVSVNGNRNGRINPIIDGVLQKEFKNIDLAIKSKSKFILDTKKHLDKTFIYNIGEIQIANYLKENNYLRDDETGIWQIYN